MQTQSKENLLSLVEELKKRLGEAEQLIEAIKAGEVDAFAVNKNNQPEVFTLQSGDYTYRVLVENFSEGALNLSEDGLIVYSNTSFHEILKLSYQKIIGKNILEFIHPESKETFKKLFRKGLAGQSKGEINLIGANGIIPVYVSLTSLYPKLPTVGVVVSDLRERKIHEQILLQKKQLEIANKSTEDSEKRYNMMLMQSPFAFSIFKGRDMVIEIANQPFKDVLGKGNDIEGKPLIKVLPELKGQPFPQYLDDVYCTGKPFIANEALCKLYRNGRVEDAYFNFVYQPFRDVDDSIIGITCIAYEVTNEVLAKQKIEESEAKFRTMAESSDILIGVNNETIDAVYFNKTWEKLTGRPVEDMLKLGWADLLHPDDKEPFMNKFLTAFKNKESYDGEFRILNKEGNYSWLYAKVAVRLHPDGSYAGHISSCIDITERKKNETALKESEKQLHLIADAIPLLISYIDKDCRYLFKNKAYENWFGHSSEEILGKHMTEVLGDEAYKKLLPHIERVLRGEQVQFETLVPYRDGGTRCIEARYIPDFDEDKKVRGFFVSVSDITEKKKSEEINARLAAIVQSSEDAIISKTLDGIITSWNPGAEKLFGYAEIEMIGKPITTIIPAERLDEEHGIIQKITQGNTVNHIETQRLTREGKLIDISLTISPIKNAENKIIGASKIARDITEQKKVQQKIEESEKHYRQLADSLPQLVWETDAKGNQTYASRRWKEFTGLDPENTDTFEKMVHPDDMAGIIKVWSECLATGTTYRYEVRLKSKEGNYHWFQVHGEPLYNNEKEIEKWIGAFTDITERKLAEEKLKESEQYFRQLTDTVPTIIWITEPDGYCSYLNKNWYEYTGQTEKEGEGYGWLTATHPDDAAVASEAFVKANAEQKPFNHVYRLKTKKGDYRWAIDRATPKFSADGKYEGMIGTVVDIHEEKIAAEKIKESEEQLRKTTEHFEIATTAAEVGTWSLDLKSQTLAWSGLHKKMWGYDERHTDLKYEDWHTVILPGDKEAAFAEVEKALKTKTLYEASYRIKRPDNGKIRWILSTGQYFYNDAGEAVTLTGVSIDITVQKQAEIALKESERQLSELANAMPQLVWIADDKGEVIYYNDRVDEFAGAQKDKEGKWHWESLIHPDDLSPTVEEWFKSLQTRTAYKKEHRIQLKNGAYKWFLSQAIPQTDARGNIVKWFGTATDIHEIKMHEQQKDDFLKMVSHELKTPITSIKGYVQLLISMLNSKNIPGAELLPHQATLLRIDNQVSRLTRLITEMLDLSRIEAGKLELKNEKLDLNALLIQTLQDISYTSITHVINIHHEFRGSVQGDKDRLEQVLINLLNNSIKYSPENKIIDVTIHQPEHNKIAVTVKDRGIGIDEKDQAKIFERFYRSTGESESYFGGFGVGLYIVKEIIARHHGDIYVESEKGKGAAFTFVLPLLPENHPDEAD